MPTTRLSIYHLGRGRVAEVLGATEQRNGDIVEIEGAPADRHATLGGAGLPGDVIPERDWSSALAEAVSAAGIAS